MRVAQHPGPRRTSLLPLRRAGRTSRCLLAASLRWQAGGVLTWCSASSERHADDATLLRRPTSSEPDCRAPRSTRPQSGSTAKHLPVLRGFTAAISVRGDVRPDKSRRPQGGSPTGVREPATEQASVGWWTMKREAHRTTLIRDLASEVRHCPSGQDMSASWGTRRAHGPRQGQTTNKAQVADLGLRYGAGDGNRTRALSLGSSCSTIKLHPRNTAPEPGGGASSHTLPHHRAAAYLACPGSARRLHRDIGGTPRGRRRGAAGSSRGAATERFPGGLPAGFRWSFGGLSVVFQCRFGGLPVGVTGWDAGAGEGS